MKECEATTTKVDLVEIEQIVEKLERGEEVESSVPLLLWSFGPCLYTPSLHFLCSFVFCPLVLTSVFLSFVPIVIRVPI